MMKFLLLVFLTQYAVKCDDSSNYYVVEVPEDEPTTLTSRALRRPFRAYWNVPTMQCKSKKVLFKLEEYGILQNKDDEFRGDKITILYDPGLFPALLKNESSGEMKFRNGGVPQEGNMTLHLDAFTTTLEQSIPDENFDGVGIIDFESWRPVFRQNFGTLVPYKDVSYEIEKKLHWWWNENWIQSEAKQRFEASARAFMQTTLSVAKQMRPRALWGYYGFPYCFNMGTNNKVEQCADNVNKENDGTYWLWSESTALYPSVYSSEDLSSSQLAALIRGRVKEATRVRRRYSPVLPYFWFRYRDGGFMSEIDLSTALKALYNSNASGLIIWGSSNDVNTLNKCKDLLNYVQNTLGPAIAKYTKANIREDDEYPSTTESFDVTTENYEPSNNTSILDNVLYPVHNAKVENSTVVNTKFIPIDPKFPWVPPANYSEEISQFVEEELIKKDGYNETKLENEIANGNQSLLMEIMINSILDNILDSDYGNVSENITSIKSTDNESQSNLTTVEYTPSVNNIATSTSNYVLIEQTTLNNLVTKNPFNDTINKYQLKSTDPSMLIIKEEENKFTTEMIDSNYTAFTTTENFDLTSQIIEEISSFDPHNIIIDTVEGTTEILTPNTTSIFDSNIYDQGTVTETEELLSRPTADIKYEDVTTFTESINLTTENIDEFIAGTSDLMKLHKKEEIGFREDFVDLSTNSPFVEKSEPEQVVIYIS